MRLLTLVALLALQVAAVHALRVLMVATVSTRSHYIWTNALTEGLLKAGHQVVELTSLRPASPHPNRTTFAIGKFFGDDHDYGEIEDIGADAYPWTEMQFVTQFGIDIHRWTFESQAFKDIVEYLKINQNKKFDVMVIDYEFQEYLIGLAHLAGRPPIVAITAYLNPSGISTLLGNPLVPSVVPHEAVTYHNNMMYLERVSNFLYYVMYAIGEIVYFEPAAQDLYRQHFGPAAPAVAELRQDVALALVNSHPALHGVRPLTPNIIEVGLLQAKPAKPLPKNIKEWLDGSPDGFVFMSLGTVIQSIKIKAEKRLAILKAFASLKQRVLWKFESADLLGELPPNVRIEKWLPQNDILAHPKIRAFVSHCGGLSSQELAYHGTPVLGIPLIVDQFSNAKKNEKLGLGRIVAYSNVTYDSFLSALNDVIHNPRYRSTAKRLSALLRDQKETPLERAVWWVEHVARSGGAHLRSHVRAMAWYQVYMLDVLALILCPPLLLMWLLCARKRKQGRTSTSHAKRD